MDANVLNDQFAITLQPKKLKTTSLKFSSHLRRIKEKNAPIILRTEHAQGRAVTGKLSLDLTVQPHSQGLSVTAPSALSRGGG